MIKTQQLTNKLLEKFFLHYLEERLHVFISKIRQQLAKVGYQFHLRFIQVIADNQRMDRHIDGLIDTDGRTERCITIPV